MFTREPYDWFQECVDSSNLAMHFSGNVLKYIGFQLPLLLHLLVLLLHSLLPWILNFIPYHRTLPLCSNHFMTLTFFLWFFFSLASSIFKFLENSTSKIPTGLLWILWEFIPEGQNFQKVQPKGFNYAYFMIKMFK